jgi:enamine deaminase RidA (YjgF/YER057c/UK114 family)
VTGDVTGDIPRRISSGSPFEDVVGYSRAVAAGDQVWVSGCTSVVDGQVVHAGDMGAQATQAISIISTALGSLGCSLADVVRTRVYVTDIARWQEVAAAHRTAFGDVRPAATMVEVSALIDPGMLVEIEAVAYKPGVGR